MLFFKPILLGVCLFSWIQASARQKALHCYRSVPCYACIFLPIKAKAFQIHITGIQFCTGFRLLCETWEVLNIGRITYFGNMPEQAPVYGSVSLTIYYPTFAFHSGLLYSRGPSEVFKFLCLHTHVVSAQSYRIGLEASICGEQGREQSVGRLPTRIFLPKWPQEAQVFVMFGFQTLLFLLRKGQTLVSSKIQAIA